jgi:hypothetical protein
MIISGQDELCADLLQVMPEHVLRALTSLGFPDFVEEVTATWNQFKEDSKGEQPSAADLRAAYSGQLPLLQACASQQSLGCIVRVQGSDGSDS